MDLSMLFSPEDPIPLGTYTQYTINLYEPTVTRSVPIKEHGYIIGYAQEEYSSFCSETYVVGPGNAGFMIKMDSRRYDDERLSYYKTHPWARR